ncbi:MAG: hypothetical protein LBV61_09830 [Burkholderiaceae bacterium]|jgi:hypothetical protein|nr:hypothetical protein [Burkholderiaceae bacterium]
MQKLDPNTFPHLYGLVSGWFHQDWEDEFDGPLDSTPKVIAAFKAVLEDYRNVYSTEECAAVVRDIDLFLALPGDNLDNEFTSTFNAGGMYLPGWGISAREWLQRARELLS